MTTLSVPLNDDLLDFVGSLVEDHDVETKAGAVRKALHWYREHMFMQEILQAQKDAKDGIVLRGDLDELADKI